MAKLTPFDALRLSGLLDSCNALNLQSFVGQIRRSRRVRREQSTLFRTNQYVQIITFSRNHQKR